MLIYQEFLAINEELPAFSPNERLRYAVHEIITRMKEHEKITFEEMSVILIKEFKIDISEEILKDLLDKWDRYNKPDYSIFKKEDKDWMDVYVHMEYVKRKTKSDQNFGKHRRKEISRAAAAAKSTSAAGYWVGNRWYAYGGRNANITNAEDTRYTYPYEDYYD